MSRRLEQSSQAYAENHSQIQGLPEEWFKAHIKANATFPQGIWILDFAVAPTLLRSILEEEVTPKETFSSNFSAKQTDDLRHKADIHHRAFGITPENTPLTDTQLSLSWKRGIAHFSELGSSILNWRNAEKNQDSQNYSFQFSLHDNPLEKINLLSQELADLLIDPHHKDKFITVLQLAEAGYQSLEKPESRAAAIEHRRLASEDHDYEICLGPALKPVYKNIEIAVEKKAQEIEQNKGIIVPSYVKAWFIEK